MVDTALALGITNVDGQFLMVKHLMGKGATEVNYVLIAAASMGHISVSKFLVASELTILLLVLTI